MLAELRQRVHSRNLNRALERYDAPPSTHRQSLLLYILIPKHIVVQMRRKHVRARLIKEVHLNLSLHAYR